MLKKLMMCSAKWMAMLALAAGSLSIHVACDGTYYQPEVPERLVKIDKD